MELIDQNIPFGSQAELKIHYLGRELKKKYISDFKCFEKTVLEIKAVKRLEDEHRAQLFN